MRTALVAFAVLVVSATLESVGLLVLFPTLPRLVTDFSPAYLSLDLERHRSPPPSIVFLGDSVLWGFRLPAALATPSLIRRAGAPVLNLSFKSGNPPNDYALALLLARRRVAVRCAVIEVNQKVFNVADAEYGTLHPAIAALSRRLLDRSDRRSLAIPAPPTGVLESIAAAAALWLPYALRSDIRESVLPIADMVPIEQPTADDFEGTYDLSPLTPANLGVRYLERTLDVLRRAGIVVVGYTTPTNHGLLHEYIDSPQYRRNDRYLISILKHGGAVAVDLDHAIRPAEFFDNDHLRASGQRHLTKLLQPALGEACGK